MTRAREFNLLLILSLVFFSVSLPGYFGGYGFLVAVTQPAVGVGPFPRQSWEVAGGRFAVWTYRANPGEVTGYKVRWRGEFRTPRLDRHALAGFDAHPFPPSTGTGGLAYLFSFPLWCIILPSLIAPGWWVYQRYRRRSDPQLGPQGFPVNAEPGAGRRVND